MIEEAAGTRMYESKRASAQRTIEKKDSKLKEIEVVSWTLSNVEWRTIIGGGHAHLPVYIPDSWWRDHANSKEVEGWTIILSRVSEGDEGGGVFVSTQCCFPVRSSRGKLWHKVIYVEPLITCSLTPPFSLCLSLSLSLSLSNSCSYTTHTLCTWYPHWQQTRQQSSTELEEMKLGVEKLKEQITEADETIAEIAASIAELEKKKSKVCWYSNLCKACVHASLGYALYRSHKDQF